jgi:predicted flap endonuclease-1-like 5' DNA nuclease
MTPDWKTLTTMTEAFWKPWLNAWTPWLNQESTTATPFADPMAVWNFWRDLWSGAPGLAEPFAGMPWGMAKSGLFNWQDWSTLPEFAPLKNMMAMKDFMNLSAFSDLPQFASIQLTAPGGSLPTLWAWIGTGAAPKLQVTPAGEAPTLELTAEKPAPKAKAPKAAKPAAAVEAAPQPVVAQPVVAQPVVAQPVAPEPALAAPAALEAAPEPAPVAAAPVAAEPVTAAPAVDSFLLDKPQGPADALVRIKGIGPKLAALLNSLGIYHFWQLAGLTPEQVAWLDGKLDFPGRVMREKWVEQSAALAAETR